MPPHGFLGGEERRLFVTDPADVAAWLRGDRREDQLPWPLSWFFPMTSLANIESSPTAAKATTGA